jgi:hypothetical protein
MAKAIIASCELKPAPRRLVLGSDAYKHIEEALVERLALLRSQKESRFLYGFGTLCCATTTIA